jgi:sirohydrochlorin cobaltochelatase
MIRAAGARIREALEDGATDIALHDMLLVVVGRGASDPDANSNVTKSHPHAVGGFWVRLGRDRLFRRDVSAGRAGSGEGRAARLQAHRRVPVFPVHGILVQRIYDATDAVAARHPEIEFLKAPT